MLILRKVDTTAQRGKILMYAECILYQKLIFPDNLQLMGIRFTDEFIPNCL